MKNDWYKFEKVGKMKSEYQDCFCRLIPPDCMSQPAAQLRINTEGILLNSTNAEPMRCTEVEDDSTDEPCSHA